MEHLAYIEGVYNYNIKTFRENSNVFVQSRYVHKIQDDLSLRHPRNAYLSYHHGYADIDVLHKELVQFIGQCPDLEQVRFEGY